MRWSEATLGDIARWGSGGTPTAGRSEFYGGDIPWAVIGDLADGPLISTQKSITAEGLASSSAKLVPTGALLVAMYGSIGKLGITTRRMATNQAIAFAIPHDDVDLRFLFYYLLSQRAALARAGKGATQQNIGQGLLKRWPIRYPELPEQQRIVEILQDHLSRLDAARGDVRRSSSRIETLKLGYLSRVRRELDLRLGSVQILEVCDTSLGKMLDAKRQVGTPTRYLRNINVRWGGFDLSDVKETRLTEDERARLTVQPGDLLVCEGGEPGRCAVWSEPSERMAFQKALHRVRPRDPSVVDTEFVALMLTEAIRSGRLDRLFTGTTIKHLPQDKLRTIELPMPSISEQRTVVSSWRALQTGVDRLDRELDDADLRAEALRRALLAAAFSGRLTRSA